MLVRQAASQTMLHTTSTIIAAVGFVFAKCKLGKEHAGKHHQWQCCKGQIQCRWLRIENSLCSKARIAHVIHSNLKKWRRIRT